MQNTRLTNLIDGTADRLGDWLRNPWRRVSVLIISLLGGNFFGSAVSTVSGQRAELDIVIAAILVIITELVSLIAYRRTPDRKQSLLLQSINTFKVGMVYSLFVEAFKLGS